MCLVFTGAAEADTAVEHPSSWKSPMSFNQHGSGKCGRWVRFKRSGFETTAKRPHSCWESPSACPSRCVTALWILYSVPFQYLCIHVFPADCQFRLYGSSCTKFGFKDSDVNIDVKFPSHVSRKCLSQIFLQLTFEYAILVYECETSKCFYIYIF